MPKNWKNDLVLFLVLLGAIIWAIYYFVPAS